MHRRIPCVGALTLSTLTLLVISALALNLIIISAASAQGRMPPISPEKYDAAQKKAAEEWPSQALLTEIETWLSTNFDLPAIHEHPTIEFVPAVRLTALRYNVLLPDSWQEIKVNGQVMEASQLPDVVAVYHDTTRTIYLADTWTGATPTELSILVHEMVHHLQNLGGLKYECPGAREKLAYIAQEEWLKRYGLDLQQAFDLDAFTLLVKSICMP